MKRLGQTVKMLGLVIITAIASSCSSTDAPLPCRFSGDFTQCFLYLSKNLALTKNTTFNGPGGAATFAIVKAHWVGTQEVAAATEDSADETIVARPEKLGLDSSGNWLFIFGGQVPSPTNGSILLINLSSEVVYSADITSSLEAKLKTKGLNLPSFNLEPSSVFFDHRMVAHFSPKGTVPN